MVQTDVLKFSQYQRTTTSHKQIQLWQIRGKL